MRLVRFSKCLAMVAVLGAFVAGCKDDAPKPGPDTAASASAKGKPKAKTELPKMSPQATKGFRMDACYFGTLSIKQTRDAYLKSLGGAEPSEAKVPSFGEFPDLDLTGKKKADAAAAPSGSGSAAPAKTAAPKATAKATAAAKPSGTAQAGKVPGGEPARPNVSAPRLPFVRYVHSCTLAKNVPGAADPKIDEALKSYEEYIVALNKNILAASQYYSRDEHKKDQAAKGKELHKQLTEQFAKLDERIEAFSTAFAEWRTGQAKIPDQLDASGDQALSAVDDARKLTYLFLAKEIDAAAVKAGIEKLTAAADALEKTGADQPQAAFPKAVGPTLRAFVGAATDGLAAVEAKSFAWDKLYVVTATFTALSEAGNRGVTRHLYAANRGAGGPALGPHGPRGPRPQVQPPKPGAGDPPAPPPPQQ